MGLTMASNQCSETVGKGAVGYLCRLSPGHVESEGSPHMAPEHGPSTIAYAKWERESKSPAQASPPEVDPPPGETPPPQDGAESPWRTDAERIAIAQVSLTKPFAELPPAVASWVRGAQAQLSLIELWEATEDGPITLSRESLTGLVPEYLRTQ